MRGALDALLALHRLTPDCACSMCYFARTAERSDDLAVLLALIAVTRLHMHGPVACWCPMCHTARMPIRQGGKKSDYLPPNPVALFPIPDPVLPQPPAAVMRRVIESRGPRFSPGGMRSFEEDDTD